MSVSVGDRGSTVVKVLCYKSEGRWFDPSWCQWNFHWHKILLIALWSWGRFILEQKWVPGVFHGGKGGRCVRLTNLPPSCAVVIKSGNLNFLEPSGPLHASNVTALPFAEWVCNLSYATCNAHTPYCHLCLALHYKVFPHYLINGMFFENKLLNTKCVFWFSLQLLSETFLILWRTERDMIKNVYFYHISHIFV